MRREVIRGNCDRTDSLTPPVGRGLESSQTDKEKPTYQMVVLRMSAGVSLGRG